ncbi:ABC transporter permease [Thermoleophilum album]|uniref:Sulfate transport system permease protein n=1 Tax=Thermoleophilum album TaxID=29539 RepID=A0A1H6FPM3_THEAL|nr:sulfate ABC transporter permease subunit [Thermoleophilum album]SEH12302.1 sulfate transport system permease protein [Thermoleophilum album]
MSAELVATGPRRAAGRARRQWGALALRTLALAYLGVLLVVPLAFVVYRALEPGVAQFVRALTALEALSALRLTVLAALVATVVCAVFGTAVALVVARSRLPGTRFVDSLLDVPLAVSPVVVGLALLALFGRGGWLEHFPVKVAFTPLGVVVATTFICVPYVARELIPVLRALGSEREQAALTLGAGPLQAFRLVTLPALRLALVHGAVLSLARALGEFGAVSVISGNLVGQTQTLTLLIQQRYENFDLAGAYAAALMLAAAACAALVLLLKTTGASSSARARDGEEVIG